MAIIVLRIDVAEVYCAACRMAASRKTGVKVAPYELIVCCRTLSLSPLKAAACRQ